MKNSRDLFPRLKNVACLFQCALGVRGGGRKYLLVVVLVTVLGSSLPAGGRDRRGSTGRPRDRALGAPVFRFRTGAKRWRRFFCASTSGNRSSSLSEQQFLVFVQWRPGRPGLFVAFVACVGVSHRETIVHTHIGGFQGAPRAREGSGFRLLRREKQRRRSETRSLFGPRLVVILLV